MFSAHDNSNCSFQAIPSRKIAACEVARSFRELSPSLISSLMNIHERQKLLIKSLTVEGSCRTSRRTKDV